jgi:uncharacterized protein DUF998
MPPRSALIRRLAAGSIAGQLAWVMLVAAGGLAEPGYNAIRDPVSALGAGTAAHPWTFEVAVTIWGASFIAAAVAVALDGPRAVRGLLGPGLIAFTGLAEVLSGFPFPADCSPTRDAGCHAGEVGGSLSWQHYAHGWAYFLGAIALWLSVPAMAWRFRGDRRWGRADLLALGSALLGIPMFLGLFFATGDGMHDHYGLSQRLALAAGGLWVGSLTVGLLAIHGKPHDLAVRFVAWIRTLPGGRAVARPCSGFVAERPER